MEGARKQPGVHTETFGSVRDRTMRERVMHWKPHIEEIYRALGYGSVTVSPVTEAIDEYGEISAEENTDNASGGRMRRGEHKG